ncbi:hypothetical protein OG604_20040 [Streptomyces sp. NBC_01231]|nr:hypothetical protein OG604_20040 [Streptomyces sp. NBC_01231]
MRVGNILRDSYLGLLYRWSQDPGPRIPLHIELREVLRIVLTGVLSYSQHGRGIPAPSPLSPPPAATPARTGVAGVAHAETTSAAIPCVWTIGRRKILPIQGAEMLRFMDWSVVATGCLLVLGSLVGRWWERTQARRGEVLDQRLRFLWAWLPLLMGLGMISTKVSGLLHAPRPVVETVDALNFMLAVVVLVFVLWTVRRFFRARGTI